MSRITLVLLALAVACSGAPEAPKAIADSAPTPPPLGYLAGLDGQYPLQTGLWESEPLRSRMTLLLGSDYETFLQNVRASGPVRLERGLVYVTGNCPSSATVWGAGALVADPAADRLLVKLYSEQWDSVRTYQDGEITALPGDVMKVLAGWAERMERGRKPGPARKTAKQDPG